MNMADKTIKSRLSRNNVPLNTYLSWKVDDSFDVVVDVESCRIARQVFLQVL